MGSAFIIVVDLVTSLLILFAAYSRRVHALPTLCKIGLAALAFGFFGESSLNVKFILTGADILSDSFLLVTTRFRHLNCCYLLFQITIALNKIKAQQSPLVALLFNMTITARNFTTCRLISNIFKIEHCSLGAIVYLKPMKN
jgi:hypothetical protein